LIHLSPSTPPSSINNPVGSSPSKSASLTSPGHFTAIYP
jgi:hypothetical protein